MTIFTACPFSYRFLTVAVLLGLVGGCVPAADDSATRPKANAVREATVAPPMAEAVAPGIPLSPTTLVTKPSAGPSAPAATSPAPAVTTPAVTTPSAAAQSNASEGPRLVAPSLNATTNATNRVALASQATPKEEEPRPVNDISFQASTPLYLKDVPLIPREILFGNPDKAAARISPDGKRLSYLAPVDGVLNVWVGPADKPDEAKPVTKDTKRGIRSYFWAYTSQHILYLQDSDGDENWHVYSVDLNNGEIKDLTPLDKVAAQIDNVSHRFPNEIVVGLNDRDPRYHDLYRINISTGQRDLIQKNVDQETTDKANKDKKEGEPEQLVGFNGFVTDDDYQIRFASRYAPTGGLEYLAADGKGWKSFMNVSMEDEMTTNPAGFDKTGNILYLIDSRGRDTGALTTLDLKSGEQKVLAANDKADIGGALVHPTENTIEAVSFNYTRKEWQVLDPKVAADLEFLRTVANGDIEITSRTLDDKTWTVAYLMDNGPVRYYLYHREAKKAVFLFTSRKDLEGLPLVSMHPVVIKSRDGLDLVCYLTLPKNTDVDGDARPYEPLPLVLNVHGGPWVRDDWGYDAEHQLLANRGYAVLAVNYRGSTGFGKKFVNAGNREWAAKMHDDLVDTVKWCIAEKVADPKKIAILGGSYGGYATLVGLTFTPDVFACGVDIVGPSSLETLLNTIPPYWEPAIQMFKDRVGDHKTEEGRKFLGERSPLNYVDRIVRPLLIGQGANDPRVKQTEADQIVQAMQQKQIPVTYVLYPDEGHGFARPQNRLSFNAVTEAFLATHLGGRYQPIGSDFAGSTITVPTGAQDIPGLIQALGQRDKQEGLPGPDKK